jgi:hypothetical protein
VNNSAEAISAGAQERLRRGERDVGEYIREEPLTALAIAGAAGFILGGGANSRIGLALLAIVGRIALRGAATSFIVGLVSGNSDNQNPDRAKACGESHGNRKDDHGRTDFRNPD